MWLLYVKLLGAEQIRVCVSRIDQSTWTASDRARNDAHVASTGVL